MDPKPRNQLNRRQFIQTMGASAALLSVSAEANTVFGYSRQGNPIVENPNRYGGYLVEQLMNQRGTAPYQIRDWMKPYAGDNPDKPAVEIPEGPMFPPKDPGERRDYSNMARRLNKDRGSGKIPNFTRVDIAFKESSWWGNHQLAGNLPWTLENDDPWQPEELDLDWEDASHIVKRVGNFFGASLTGVGPYNPLWVYEDNLEEPNPFHDREHYYGKLANYYKESLFRASQPDSGRYQFRREDIKTAIENIQLTADQRSKLNGFRAMSNSEFAAAYQQELQDMGRWGRRVPLDMKTVIVLVFEEDYYAIGGSYGQIASGSVGNAYSRMAFTAGCVADFVRRLGYRAVPAGNDTALSVPMAIDAGLGQQCRIGFLMTPKFGPRVRLAKVITDMPLALDVPIDFGVTEFCEACMLCAEHCPSNTITEGGKTWEGPSPQNFDGAHKWYVTPETCNAFNDFSCSNCKKVCPFNKPNNSALHRAVRKFVSARSESLDKAMVFMDQISGYGHSEPPPQEYSEDSLANDQKTIQSKDFWKMDPTLTITGREPV